MASVILEKAKIKQVIAYYVWSAHQCINILSLAAEQKIIKLQYVSMIYFTLCATLKAWPRITWEYDPMHVYWEISSTEVCLPDRYNGDHNLCKARDGDKFKKWQFILIHDSSKLTTQQIRIYE